MRNTQNEQVENAFKVAKRIGITMLCCIPILIAFGFLTRKVITSNVLQIVCFVGIMAVAVVIEETVAHFKNKAKKEKQVEHKDVFK